MSRTMFRLLLLLLLSLAAMAVTAAAPATLGYQGNLANAAGQPITANLTITFRLYDVPAGGSALWTETQPNVAVDGGNLAVELGRITPLPRGVWGRQLYLGMQVSGDSEMLPRPALTATPFALRAAGTMKRTVLVSAEGTALENGTALIAAVAAITDASASSPVAVEIDAGTFDLGTERLELPQYTALIGRGQDATLIVSANASAGLSATLVLASNSSARQLTARNVGIPSLTDGTAVGIAARDINGALTLRNRVSLEQVTGESVAASGSLGNRIGISVCAVNSDLTDVIGVADGGQIAMGLRADCTLATNNRIDGATLYASGGSLGLRGAYLSGGGVWRGVQAIIGTNTAAETVYGIRVFWNGAFGVPSAALLVDATVDIRGNNIATPTSTQLVEGLRVENNVDLDVNGLIVRMNDVRGASVAGARLSADPTETLVTRIVDADFQVAAVQDAALASGSIWGIRAQGATPVLDNVRISVDCLPGSYNGCFGVRGELAAGNPAIPVNPMVLDQCRIEVAHRAPADGSAQSVALEAVGDTQVRNSSLKVQVSPANETAVVFGTSSASARMQVLNSNLVLDNPATPNAGCAYRGSDGSTLELFGNHLQGNSCAGPAVLRTCAGNTRRGGGLFAGSCP